MDEQADETTRLRIQLAECGAHDAEACRMLAAAEADIARLRTLLAEAWNRN